MCDTLVGLPSVTARKHTLLAKNSDREPDEAQAITFVARETHEEKPVKCTYITVPQIRETYACVLSRPFQMWGAEMGANEWGLAIGNEAVFTRINIKKENTGLTGMDLLRLALERSKTAKAALNCIIELLETYGQDACGGYRNKKFFYHNSFLIADAQVSFVLETVGRHWAYKTVTGYHSISNRLGIGTDADMMSKQAKAYAISRHWWKGKTPFDFGRTFNDWLYTRIGRGKIRQSCTFELVGEKLGKLTVSDCFGILSHHHVPEPNFNPKKATTAAICMHATGLLNPSQTTGSMVAELRKKKSAIIWLTATSNPCLSIYIPFFVQAPIESDLLLPTASPDNSLWWRAKKLQNWVGKDYTNRRAALMDTRNQLQASFLKAVDELPTIFSYTAYAGLTKNCLTRVADWIDEEIVKAGI